jgi:hypothetical protein
VFQFSAKSYGVIECNCSKNSKANLISLVSGLLSLFATAFAFFDHLTPIFAGVFDFRWRILASILLLGIALFFTIRMMWLKHSAPGSVVGSNLLHFSYDKNHRFGAKLILLPLVLAFVVSIYHIKYWFGASTIIQGQVLDSFNKALQDVRVEALNLDKSLIHKEKRPEFTSSEGFFVIDIKDCGRLAFLRFTRDECEYTEEIADSQYKKLIWRESDDQQIPQEFIPDFSCFDK